MCVLHSIWDSYVYINNLLKSANTNPQREKEKNTLIMINYQGTNKKNPHKNASYTLAMFDFECRQS